MSLSSFKKNGYSYISAGSFKKELSKIKVILKNNFSKNIQYYNNLSLKKFRNISNKSLKQIYLKVDINLIKKKISDCLSNELLTENDFYASSYITLLVTRPHKEKKFLTDNENEFHDFHRETFYAGKKKLYYVKYQMNCWIPIFNITKNQNMMFIPKSHKIPDKKIVVREKKSKIIKKGSISHKLGYLHTQKKIIKGVDLTKAKRFEVPKNKFLLFNGNLIHGNGINFSKKIRFAIGIGIINGKNILKKMPINFRSGQSHFKKIV